MGATTLPHFLRLASAKYKGATGIVTNGKNLHKKNFGGTLAGGSRRGLRRPNSLCRCWFSQQNTVHKEFRGGGSKGSWGWGLRSNFGAPFLYVYVLFWGLK